ncbi:unnamed protein product [Victoria cruziana]
MVADSNSGDSVESTVRTSSGYFLAKGQDDVVTRIEDRIAAWTLLPKENGESIHILRYEVGQKYEPHFDYFHDPKNIALGGHRMATVLMYLADVEMGGETVFPNSEDVVQEKDDSWSDCGKSGLAVKPRKGDAILFFSLHPDATTDKASLHGSCPVIKGEKWSATCWIHVRRFGSTPHDSEGCLDENQHCSLWAAAGECEKNPAYMHHSCKKSCNKCKA